VRSLVGLFLVQVFLERLFKFLFAPLATEVVVLSVVNGLSASFGSTGMWQTGSTTFLACVLPAWVCFWSAIPDMSPVPIDSIADACLRRGLLVC
jgi:hypothetical protein